MSELQRREFLTGAAAIAAATATLAGSRRASGDDKPPRPIRGDKGAPIIGPTNPSREAQNLDRLVDSTVFPATTTISAALVEVEPGGMRELHWHPNSDELQYHIAGESRMTVFASGSTASTFDYQPGDVAYVPRNMAHYIENTGTMPLKYIEVWKTNKFSDVSLRQWLAFTPHDLVQAHLKIDTSILNSIPTRKTPVLPA